MIELHTRRLLLRDFRAADAARVFEYQSTPDYLRNYDGDPPTRESVERLVAMFCEWAVAMPRTKFQLAITLDGRVIGTCGVRGDDADPAVAEYGCELDPEHWGHGYALEASRAILEFALAELKVDRVIAKTLPQNAAAIRLARALGFHESGNGAFILTCART